MNRKLAILLLFGSCLFAEDSADKISVPVKDMSRPVRITTQLMTGSITVRGADVKEVSVEGHGQGRLRRDDEPSVRADGLKRLDIPGGAGIEISDNNNVFNIKTSPWGGGNLTVTVPRKSNLQVKTMSGEISIEGVDGEIDANAMSGRVSLTNVSGSVVAHSLNGAIVVTLNRVDAGKPMSFSTMNGAIDVTLPDSIKADLAVKVDNGEVYTDFDVKATARGNNWTEDGSHDGMRRRRLDRTFHGTINGGGPELTFTSFNGQISIRRKK